MMLPYIFLSQRETLPWSVNFCYYSTRKAGFLYVSEHISSWLGQSRADLIYWVLSVKAISYGIPKALSETGSSKDNYWTYIDTAVELTSGTPPILALWFDKLTTLSQLCLTKEFFPFNVISLYMK